MQLSDVRDRLEAVEPQLAQAVFVEFHSFERHGRTIRLALTERLLKITRKARVWKSRQFLVTLKNAAYGYDERAARSLGGRDGIFVLDRDHRPPNAMMQKLFDHYLDKPGSGADDLAKALGVKLGELVPVRLVSHHMRLLGVLARRPDADWLVLVDFDASA